MVVFLASFVCELATLFFRVFGGFGGFFFGGLEVVGGFFLGLFGCFGGFLGGFVVGFCGFGFQVFAVDFGEGAAAVVDLSGLGGAAE